MKKRLILALVLAFVFPLSLAASPLSDTTAVIEEQEVVVVGAPSVDTTVVQTFEWKELLVGQPASDADYDFRRTERPLNKRWSYMGGHYAGASLFYNGLVQDLGHLRLPPDAGWMHLASNSIGVDLNPLDFVLVSNRHFGLITGLGFEINNFRFENNIGITQNDQGYIVPDETYNQNGITLDKSKLTTVYMNIPLLVEFKIGRSGGYVNGGVVGGLRLSSHTKVKTESPSTIEKSHRGLNLRNFHYGVHLQGGYRNYGIVAKYYPQSIFTTGGGPDVRQVNIGIILTL